MGGVLSHNIIIPLWTLPIAFVIICYIAAWIATWLTPTWDRLSDWWWCNVTMRRHFGNDDDWE